MSAEACALKLCVPGGLYGVLVEDCVGHLSRNFFSTGQVNNLHRLIVKSVGEEKNVKVALDVFINTAFS